MADDVFGLTKAKSIQSGLPRPNQVKLGMLPPPSVVPQGGDELLTAISKIKQLAVMNALQRIGDRVQQEFPSTQPYFKFMRDWTNASTGF